MKKFSLIAIMLIATMLIVGCSHNAEVSKNADESSNVSFLASNTEIQSSKIVTENESSTQISTTETTTAQTTTTKPKETEKSTTAKSTTTKPVEQKSTVQSTKKAQTTTKQQTTTKKQTTTTKKTTTKKVTTTEDEWDCKVDGHSCKVGQIGWVNTKAEAVDKALDYLSKHDEYSNFLVEHCYWCGKYTASIT